LRSATTQLAARIAQFPAGGLNATKAALNRLLNPSIPLLNDDVTTFGQLDASPAAQAIIHKALAASDNQTNVAFEFGAPDTYVNLTKS
jgi:hypothetical protein